MSDAILNGKPFVILFICLVFENLFRYGKITELIMYDNVVTLGFSDEDSVDRILLKGHHIINDRVLEASPYLSADISINQSKENENVFLETKKLIEDTLTKNDGEVVSRLKNSVTVGDLKRVAGASNGWLNGDTISFYLELIEIR